MNIINLKFIAKSYFRGGIGERGIGGRGIGGRSSGGENDGGKEKKEQKEKLEISILEEENSSRHVSPLDNQDGN